MSLVTASKVVKNILSCLEKQDNKPNAKKSLFCNKNQHYTSAIVAIMNLSREPLLLAT